jgi:hypothetical protein
VAATKLLYDPRDKHREDCVCHSLPEDLATYPGRWQSPLNISFPNLAILDLEMDDAVMWLIPILDTMSPSSPLRRLLIRHCDDADLQPLPFPSDGIDRCLAHLPRVRVLLAWQTDFVDSLRLRLPQLESEGRLKVLSISG